MDHLFHIPQKLAADAAEDVFRVVKILRDGIRRDFDPLYFRRATEERFQIHVAPKHFSESIGRNFEMKLGFDKPDETAASGDLLASQNRRLRALDYRIEFSAFRSRHPPGQTLGIVVCSSRRSPHRHPKRSELGKIGRTKCNIACPGAVV
jgi:hypothetical protein